jgi:uncharacterized protein (DUF2062 family)
MTHRGLVSLTVVFARELGKRITEEAKAIFCLEHTRAEHQVEQIEAFWLPLLKGALVGTAAMFCTDSLCFFLINWNC